MKISILYIPYIFHNHETKFNFKISTSNYFSSKLKSYKNYYFKFSQHLASYTWLKFSYSYTPSFYLKNYNQSDYYISYELGYMSALFASEKIGYELVFPIPYMNKTYITLKSLLENQYYNSDFTEFDLEIKNYYFKIKRIFHKHLNISVTHIISDAENISYKNGLISTSNRNRSYSQGRTTVSFSIQKFLLFGKKTSIGVSSSTESRIFSSKIEDDFLHFGRDHLDVKTSGFFKRYLNNNMAIKFKGVYRQRVTSSINDYVEANTDYVEDLKTFNKFEVWLSFILKMDLNVY